MSAVKNKHLRITSSQQTLASLPHMAFARQIGQNLGRSILPRHSHPPSMLQQNPDAPQPHFPPSFCLISPETGLLTGKATITDPCLTTYFSDI
jgi:hypothetical protein